MQSVLCEGGRLDADRAGAELLYSERAGKKKLNEKRREREREEKEYSVLMMMMLFKLLWL
jgi:hypothetical protein